MPGPFSFFAPEGVMPGSFTGMSANSLPKPSPITKAPLFGPNLTFALPLLLGMAAEAIAPKDSGAARAGQGAQMLARQAATSKYLEDLATGKAASVSPFLVDPGALMEGQRLKKYGEVSQAQLRQGEKSRKSQEEQARLDREQRQQLAEAGMQERRDARLDEEDWRDRNYQQGMREAKAMADYRTKQLQAQINAPMLGAYYSNLFSPNPIFDPLGFQTGIQRNVDNWQIGPNGLPMFMGSQPGASGLGAALGAPGIAPPMTMEQEVAATAAALDQVLSGNNVIEAPDLPQQKPKTTGKKGGVTSGAFDTRRGLESPGALPMFAPKGYFPIPIR